MNIPQNSMLDIIISLVLIYALLSILVSIINEWFSFYFRRRNKMLKESIIKLLDDPLNVNYGKLLLDNYLIQKLHKINPPKTFLFYEKKEEKLPPQYISSSMFADALIDVISNHANHMRSAIPERDENGVLVLDAEGGKIYPIESISKPATPIDKFKVGLQQMNLSPFRDTMESFAQKASDYKALKSSLENWFNDYMDRVSGWYKTQQRKKLLVIGFVVSIGLNVDSIHLVKTISLDEKLRSSLVRTAEQVADNYRVLSDSAKIDNSSLIKSFSENDTVVKASMDSIRTASNIDPLKKPQMLIDILIKKDSVRYHHLIANLIKNDSLGKVMTQQSDSVLGIISSLSIPIGYNRSAAPRSWKCKYIFGNEDINMGETTSGLLLYNQRRNAGELYGLYFIGIIISGFALSFGAPFWFELLVKLVDMRRAGVKPGTSASKKSEKE